MTKDEQVAKILADILGGCPLLDPCSKIWTLEGWCKDHCKPGQQEPDAECWLKYAEAMVKEAENSTESSLTQNGLDIPDTNVDDMISRREAIEAVEKESQVDGAYGYMDTKSIVDLLNDLPSAQPKWNNHTVACLLAELFDDTCACNYNGIDEWLPEKCEVIDSCPNPVGVACWEQYLKHRAERRTDE